MLTRHFCFGLLLAVYIFPHAALGAESPRTVSPEVAALLTEVAAAEPADVVTRINAAATPLHPLLLLSRGQAYWRLSQDMAQVTAQDATTETELSRVLTAAEKDFTATLTADPTLKQAHLGLAQCAAAREDWPTAARQAGLGIDPGTADRSLITFLASTALHAGDWRLATLAAQTGILRFSDDQQLRRIELAVLVHADRGEDARQAVLALLAQNPSDAELWQHLAWAAQQTGRNDEAVAALEAALVVKPDDRNIRRSLVEAQLGRGQPQAAFVTVQPLFTEPISPVVLADEGLMLLASRAAAEGGGDAGCVQARAWLAAVPEAQRSRAQHVQAARLAVRAGDTAAAAAALEILIAAGESDPAVLTWAASLAENTRDFARAEALYLRASATESAAAGPATLRLAGLYLGQDRREEARILLATYLSQKPDDTQAHALQTQLERAR